MSTITHKRYKCKRCGYVGTQATNHYGETYSWGHYNACPNCPPYAKYPEFGGLTIWQCLETSNHGRDAGNDEVDARGTEATE